MTIVAGVTMVKDEEDIIETTLRHMLTQVDVIYVADNMSTDGTHEIIEKVQADVNARTLPRLLMLIDKEPAYYQSKKMTRLAHMAHQGCDADWIVPFDADEIWYSSFAPTLKERLAPLGPQWQVVQAELYDHVSTALDDLSQPDPTQRIRWRTAAPLDLPKVACRWREDLVIDMGNHRAFYDESGTSIHPTERFVVRHFPYRGPKQFLSKVRNGAAAYNAAGEDLAEFGGHWRSYGGILDAGGPDVVLANVYDRWFYDQNPARSAEEGRRPIIEDPAPVRR